MEEEKQQIVIPENFRSIIGDFTNDLSNTYPEYSYLWIKWGSPDLKEEELKDLFQYITTIYPERFFDILYQNDDIFKLDNKVNVYFLPNVDFKLLFHCENVTENTRKAIWKYLQLILFMVVNSIKSKSNFGNAKDLFDGIDEKELQEKLEETMKGITQFFSHFENESSSEGETKDKKGEQEEFEEEFLKNTEKMFENMKEIPGMAGMPNMDSFKKSFEFGKNGKGMPEMPKPEDLHEHLKGLFDGKIGKLAKEMAEEISEDMSELLGGDKGNIKSSQDVLKNLMKNPKKMMDLVKLVGDRLKSKMDSGEISQEEIMKEASDLIGKMKGGGMGGMGGEDNDMFKNMLNQMKDMDLKGMAGLAGMAGMGGMGKNARIDKNKLNNMIKQQTYKEKLRERYEKKKLASLIETSILTEKKNGFVEKTADDNYIFKLGNEKQEKSFIKQHEEKNIDTIMNELNLTNDCIATPFNSKKTNSDKTTSDKKGKKKVKK
jgi:hypothetical protein